MELNHSLVFAILINGIIAAIAYYTKTVQKSGIIGGLIVGILTYYFLGYQGYVILFSMFIMGTLATKVGFQSKQALGVAESDEGARGLSNVIAKCLPSVVFALVAWIADISGAEYNGFFFKAMLLGFVASFATGAFDTVSSEIGQVYGKRPFTLIPPKRVKPGTEGAVSLVGTLAGLIAAIIVILLGYWLLLSKCPMPFRKAFKYPLIAVIIANIIESVLGSQLEQKKLLGKFGTNLTNTVLAGTIAILLLKVL
ncbi:MAG: TIGR00297 family protein [bacterium]